MKTIGGKRTYFISWENPDGTVGSDTFESKMTPADFDFGPSGYLRCPKYVQEKYVPEGATLRTFGDM